MQKLTVCIISLLLLGCQKVSSCLSPNDQSSLAHLNIKQATHDSLVARSKHDDRFLGVNGYTLDVPGITDPTLIKQHGVKVIEGTSDALCNETHDRLDAQARRYAEIYNRAMMVENQTEALSDGQL